MDKKEDAVLYSFEIRQSDVRKLTVSETARLIDEIADSVMYACANYELEW